jgi:preprotein translocase subunit SecE
MSPTQIELGNYNNNPKVENDEEPKSLNIVQFLQEVRSEFLKITWPSKDQVTREFFSVILLVFIITGIIFLLDKVFEFIVNFFNGRLY